MVSLRPFSGLRFNPLRVGELAALSCPPYDVITPTEQAELYARSPFNLVRVELGRDEANDDETENRYSRAAALLDEWRSQRALVRELRPAIYLHEATYSLGSNEFVRQDLIGAVGLQPWGRGSVLPHEHTMVRPKEDRLRLLHATATQVSPVWTLYRGESESVGDAWEMVRIRPPQTQFVDLDGVGHRLWALSDPLALGDLARDFAERTLYMADGHHRYETALAYQREVREAGDDSPAAPHNLLMTVITAADDPGLTILPIHRVLATGHSEAEPLFLASIVLIDEQPLPEDPEHAAELVAALADSLRGATGRHFIALTGQGRRAVRFTLAEPPPEWQADRSAAWRELDVARLHGLAIDPLLSRIGSAAEDAVTFTHEARSAFNQVRGGEAQLAILVAPTRVNQVLAVADAGDRMPQKSTFFVPKVPTGLVLYPLE